MGKFNLASLFRKGRSLLDSIKLSADTSPAASAAREIIYSLGDIKGYERTYKKSSEMFRVFEIERSRHCGYRDDYVAMEESQLVEKALWNLAEDATAEPFNIKCRDARAEKELNGMFGRIEYFGQTRTELMALLNGLGDQFRYVQVERSKISKRNLGEIVGLHHRKEYSMFRLQDARGVFPNFDKAYVQLPGVELVTKQSGNQDVSFELDGLKYVNKSGSGSGSYAGLVGQKSKYEFREFGEERIYYSAEEMLHARLRPGFRPMVTGYGVSAQRSNRVTHNVVMMCVQDLAIARKLATFNRLHHKLREGSTTEQLSQYKKSVEFEDDGVTPREPNPAEQYFTIDGEIKAVDARNTQLVEIADLWLHIDMLSLALGYPLALTGFGAERFSGELLDRMENRLKRTIRVQNQIEEYEIIRRLCNLQLFYSGKLGVEYEIEFPAISLEDDNKKVKRVLSEVAAGTLSRETGYRTIHQGRTKVDWEEEMQKIEEEVTRIGPVGGRYSPEMAGKGESLDKGGKGVQKKSKAAQNITDTEGTGG